MLTSARRVAVVLLSSTLTPLALAAHTHLATPSTWTLNLSESDFGGGPSMKSDVFVITMDTEKWAKWSDNMVDSDGKNWKVSWSGPADGTAKPFKGRQTVQPDHGLRPHRIKVTPYLLTPLNPRLCI